MSKEQNVAEHEVKTGYADLQHIETGITVLRQRQKRLTSVSVVMAAFSIVVLVSLFIQKDLVFSLMGVSEQLRHLHVPFSADVQIREFMTEQNYFMNLLSWFGWLFLKIMVSFTGAFIVVAILKKFRYFMQRFQSFVLKFVTWLIAFIVLWMGLSYVQYDMQDDEDQQAQALVHYDQSIQQSEIYRLLKGSDNPPAVQDYLLVQTALMHKPADKNIATAYASKLIEAERTDPHFMEYGFSPQQLWSIQHQLYRQAVTPLARQVEPDILRAQQWSGWLNILLTALLVLTLFCSAVFYGLSTLIRTRLQRIQKKLID